MTVVFTDSFTVGANIDPASYPSGNPDYSYLLGAVNNAEVDATDDRLEIVSTAVDVVLRIIDTTAPTGDQQITADCRSEGSDDNGNVAARCAAATADCYVGQTIKSEANEVKIYRVTSGGFTLIADGDRGLANAAATHSYRLKATGTNPVELEFQVDATAAVTFSDSDASRKQSGRSGIGGYNDATRQGWVDNVSVDDLVAAAMVPPTPTLKLQAVGRAASW